MIFGRVFGTDFVRQRQGFGNLGGSEFVSDAELREGGENRFGRDIADESVAREGAAAEAG